MSRPKKILHLTVDTGHCIETERVNRAVIKHLEPLARTGTMTAGGLRFDVVRIPGGWRYDIAVGCGAPALVTCHVAVPGGGGHVWNALVDDRVTLGLPPPIMPCPSVEPWLAVSFRPAFYTAKHTEISILGDAERCVAWTLLDKGRPGRTDAVTPCLAVGPASSDELHAVAEADALLRAAREQSHPSVEAMTVAATRHSGTLASAVLRAAAAAPSNEDLASVAATLRVAGRFALDAEVVESIDFIKGSLTEVLPELGRAIRLPHDPCWLEYLPGETSAARDLGQDGRSMVADRHGYLVASGADGIWTVRMVAEMYGQVILFPVVARLEPDGIAYLGLRDLSPVMRGEMMHLMAGASGVVMRLVMMMSARNTPLSVGEAEDYERLNRKRGREGKPPVLGARPVRWNLARIERMAARGGIGLGAARDRAVAHWVRAHPKVRNGKLFWWSAHVRGADNGPVPEGRDYKVVNCSPVR